MIFFVSFQLIIASKMGDDQVEGAGADAGNPGGLCEENCVICLQPLQDDKQKIYQKALQTLIRVSSQRGDKNLHAYLCEKSSTSPIGNVYVHKLQRCRIDYTSDPKGDTRRSIDNSSEEKSPSKRLRLSLGEFNWKNDCFLCGKPAVIDARHPKRRPVSRVTFIRVRESLLKKCSGRDDSWAQDVKRRLNDCIDLVAAEAIYHGNCSKIFHRPVRNVPAGRPVGRPVDAGMQSWFKALCDWLDNEGDIEKMTLDEIHDKMTQLAGEEQVYSIKSLKNKITEHYGDIYLDQE